ncbi:MAG: hypothetical protein AB8B79_03415 [Granulosicoccus sp.]
MTTIVAITYVVLIVGVIGFQCALIAGAPWGRLTQGGKQTGPLNKPGRIAAFVSIFLLIFMAAGITSAADLPPRWPLWTGWVALGIQTCSTVANWITPSAPERKLWGPITSLLLVLCVYVVLLG